MKRIEIIKSDKNQLIKDDEKLLINVTTFDSAKKIEQMLSKLSTNNSLSISFKKCCLPSKSILFDIEIIHQACLKTIAYAKQKQLNISICLMDKSGYPTYFYRMPEAILISVSMAKKKARTSTLLNMPTSQIQPLSQPNAPLYNIEAIGNGEIVTFGGGVPIHDYQSHLIGAIGVSGATNPMDDEELANYFLKQLYNPC